MQALIVAIVSLLLTLVLLTALSVQVSINISRDISVATINEVALKSQVDENIICADARFKPTYDSNILSRPAAFTYREEPDDFLFYTFIVAQDSITDCSSLLVYQSNFA